MAIERSSLQLTRQINSGAFGVVYAAKQANREVAFKEYLRTTKPVDIAIGERAVKFRAGLSAFDRDTLDSFSAWPTDMVIDASGAACGLLMPLLGPEYFHDIWLDRHHEEPVDLRTLIHDDYIEPIDLTSRYTILALLIYALAWLHRRGWVFGDISFTNVCVRSDTLQVMLIDCDGTGPDDGTHQLHNALGWKLPGRPRFTSSATDACKAGAAILRCLTPGVGAATSFNQERLDRDLIAPTIHILVEGLLHQDPTQRPTLKHAYNTLRSVVVGRRRLPTITRADLSTRRAFRGDRLAIEWEVDNGRTVRLLDLDGPILEVALGSDPVGCHFSPRVTGPLWLEADNSHGTIRRYLGSVYVIEQPQLRDVSLTLPPLPKLSLSSRLDLSTIGPGLDDVWARFAGATRRQRLSVPPAQLVTMTHEPMALTPPTWEVDSQQVRTIFDEMATASRSALEVLLDAQKDENHA